MGAMAGTVCTLYSDNDDGGHDRALGRIPPTGSRTGRIGVGNQSVANGVWLGYGGGGAKRRLQHFLGAQVLSGNSGTESSDSREWEALIYDVRERGLLVFSNVHGCQ
jgi:hypothetical protein